MGRDMGGEGRTCWGLIWCFLPPPISTAVLFLFRLSHLTRNTGSPLSTGERGQSPRLATLESYTLLALRSENTFAALRPPRYKTAMVDLLLRRALLLLALLAIASPAVAADAPARPAGPP